MTALTDAQDEANLDNPGYAALTSVQSRFALRNGRALRYLPETVGFIALPPSPSGDDWRDAADLVKPGEVVAVIREPLTPPPPPPWTGRTAFDIVQMVEESVAGIEAPGLVSLGSADVPEMLELVALTRPGPFADRTVELGDYVGIRRHGDLVAMAGERLHWTGWAEISAVCTAPSERGHGIASALVRTLVARIHSRSERAVLHVVTANTNAIALYERLGFRRRRVLTIAIITHGES